MSSQPIDNSFEDELNPMQKQYQMQQHMVQMQGQNMQ